MASVFQTKKNPDGYSWSIVSKLGNILRDAESKYGERDNEYTILGVELKDEPQSGHWFPGNCKHIAIQITQNCSEDINRAVYQVAHEIIHCLSPTGSSSANVLEEGLATYFSAEYARNNGNGTWFPDLEKYKLALSHFQKLISIDKDIIKKVRTIQPIISLITEKDLITVNQNIPVELAEELVKKF